MKPDVFSCSFCHFLFSKNKMLKIDDDDDDGDDDDDIVDDDDDELFG